MKKRKISLFNAAWLSGFKHWVEDDEYGLLARNDKSREIIIWGNPIVRIEE